MTIEWTDEQWELIKDNFPLGLGSVEVDAWTPESLAGAYKQRIAREIPRQLNMKGKPVTDKFNDVLTEMDD